MKRSTLFGFLAAGLLAIHAADAPADHDPQWVKSTIEGAWEVVVSSFDANGLLTAKMDITSELTLAGDGLAFEGVSRFVRTDLSGNVQNFCATLAGTRITL